MMIYLVDGNEWMHIMVGLVVEKETMGNFMEDQGFLVPLVEDRGGGPSNGG